MVATNWEGSGKAGWVGSEKYRGHIAFLQGMAWHRRFVSGSGRKGSHGWSGIARFHLRVLSHCLVWIWTGLGQETLCVYEYISIVLADMCRPAWVEARGGR